MKQLHKINNQYFYKVGGKFLPYKFQDGGGDLDFVNKIQGNLESATNENAGFFGETFKDKWYHDPNTILGFANATGNMLGSLGKNPQQEVTGMRVGNAMKSYQNTGIQKGLGTALDIAAMVDPTGVSKIVNAGVKLTSGLGKIVNPGNKYGYSDSKLGEVAGNILDPFKSIQQTINVGKKHGFGEGVKNFFTAGISGNNLQKNDVKQALAADERADMLLREGMSKGNYRNDSIYAKMGAEIKPKNIDNEPDKKPNIEIEKGEIFIGDPSQIGYYGNNTKTSLESPHAVMFHGDKHGQDTNNDGMEGIPLNAPQGYIASNYLGVDGKKAKHGRTVSKEMKPHVTALSHAENNSNDMYSNNPVAKAYHLQQINQIKNNAEKNKFLENLALKLKDKNRTFEDTVNFMKENVPKQDLTSDEQQLTNQTLSALSQEDSAQQPQQEMYNQYQQGGQNPSQDRMQQLVQQAPSSGQMQQSAQQQASQEQPSPEQLQQIFAQLPPEVQQQIQQMPPEQQAQAIMQYAQQMEQQPQENQAPSMEEQMAQGQMEGAEPQMACGGYTMNKRKNVMRMGGYI